MQLLTRLRDALGQPRVVASGEAVGLRLVANHADPDFARGTYERPLQSFIVEREVPTRPAHRFVAAISAGGSFAVFAPGFFEYEWTPRGELLLTVLRSVGQLSKGELPERPGHAAWPIATPGGQELGAHRLELGMAFLPETGDLPAVLERCWEDLFLPIQAFYRRR